MNQIPANCFFDYFYPVQMYVRKAYDFAMMNDFGVAGFALISTTVITGLSEILNVNYFGVTNLLLVVVILTVFIDAYFGVKKSVSQAKEAYKTAMALPEGSIKRKGYLIVYESKKFSGKKLQYSFFKCFTLLGYLFFAKILLDIGGESSVGGETFIDSALNFSSEVIIKAPLAIFWYYDFKSIGKNTEFLYGKKAPIFTIAEMIFEPRIFKFLNKDKDGTL